MKRMKIVWDRGSGSWLPAVATPAGLLSRSMVVTLPVALPACIIVFAALTALRRSARQASWHVRLGRPYARTGDDSAAVRHFREALAEEPGLPEACDAVRALATRSTPAARLLTTCAGPR